MRKGANAKTRIAPAKNVVIYVNNDFKLIFFINLYLCLKQKNMVELSLSLATKSKTTTLRLRSVVYC